MPKPHTLPTLYDSALQISLNKLQNWDYFKPNQIKYGKLDWSRNGNNIGSISIKTDTKSDIPFVELDYEYKDEPRKYKVYLTSINSNLNKGKVWYFICPLTSKRCRILYSISGYFYHRDAFNGCMYQSQIESKKAREIDKLFGAYFNFDKHHDLIHKKHFKKFYAGKPTKKYFKLLQKIKESDKIDHRDIERAMMNFK